MHFSGSFLGYILKDTGFFNRFNAHFRCRFVIFKVRVRFKIEIKIKMRLKIRFLVEIKN